MDTKFYCADCGAEVKRNAKECPHCGSSFGAVRCPKCLFEGKSELFASGCPVCGYVQAGSEKSGAVEPEMHDKDASKTLRRTSRRSSSPSRTSKLSLPAALGIGGVLLTAIVVIVYLLLRP